MSFLEGFAKEGMRQLDVYREDKKQQDKLKEQRAYNEGRYSIERADRKQDNIDAKNLELSLEDRNDLKRIYKTPEGGFMTTVRSVGPDGMEKITTEQVTDKALITQWESWTEKNQRDAADAKLDSEHKKFRNETMRSDHALSRQVTLENLANSKEERKRRREQTGTEKNLYSTLPASERSIIDSIALGDTTLLSHGKGGDYPDIRGSRSITAPLSKPQNKASYVALARSVQAGDVDAYKELLPLISDTYKVMPKK